MIVATSPTLPVSRCIVLYSSHSGKITVSESAKPSFDTEDRSPRKKSVSVSVRSPGRVHDYIETRRSGTSASRYDPVLFRVDLKQRVNDVGVFGSDDDRIEICFDYRFVRRDKLRERRDRSR